MTENLSATQINFSQLLQELQTLAEQLQNNIIILSKNTAIDGHMPTSTHQISNITQELTALIKQLMKIQNTTLFGYEYVNFCDLIICANAMANYLTTRRTASQWVRRYANYGKRLAPRLESFLRRSWYHYSHEPKQGDVTYQICETQNILGDEKFDVKPKKNIVSKKIKSTTQKAKRVEINEQANTFNNMRVNNSLDVF